MSHYLCLTTYFHYLLPTIGAVCLGNCDSLSSSSCYLPRVYIEPLDLHSQSSRSFNSHTAKLTSSIVAPSSMSTKLFILKTEWSPLDRSQPANGAPSANVPSTNRARREAGSSFVAFRQYTLGIRPLALNSSSVISSGRTWTGAFSSR